MATSEEKRFVLGLFTAIILVSLIVLALRFVGDTESVREKPAQTSRVKSVQPRTSQVAVITRSPQQRDSRSQAVAVATPAALASSASLSADAEPQTGRAAPVIDPVPLAFFNATASAAELPDVIEKYRDRVERGALFMARLEAIVTDTALAPNENQHNLLMEFTARSQSKRLSYKSVHTTEWIEATFNSMVSPATQDVLVDVRRNGDSAKEGERVALFFASVQDYADKRGFAMNADVGDKDAIVRVYALTDELPQLGEAHLIPEDIIAE